MEYEVRSHKINFLITISDTLLMWFIDNIDDADDHGGFLRTLLLPPVPVPGIFVVTSYPV